MEKCQITTPKSPLIRLCPIGNFINLKLFILLIAVLLIPPAGGAGLAATDEIIVKFKDATEPKVVTIHDRSRTDRILDFYNSRSDVAYAEPNYRYRAAVIPSDTFFSNQWNLKKIKAPAAWDMQKGSPKIVIAVIDSGVQIDHPDLKDNIWKNGREIPDNKVDDDRNGFIDDVSGWDFIAHSPDPSPKFEKGWALEGVSHGTIVAGIIAAAGNNAAGVSGVTWKAQIMSLRVLDDRGEGRANDVIKAIDYATSNGADIINLSFNGNSYSLGMAEAIKRAYSAGIIVVAAAGNETSGASGVSLDDKPMYPICYRGPQNENWVIGVAATDTLDQKPTFSNYGASCIDIAAPGISVFSTMVYAPNTLYDGRLLDKYYDGYWSGTSVAAPAVSGAIALIEAANPKYDRNRTVQNLLSNADNLNRLNPKYLNQLGWGRVNLEKSVAQAVADRSRAGAKIIYAAWSGGAKDVRISDETGKGDLSFSAFANFTGGVSLAAGDLNGDGKAEIIAAPGKGGGPQVKIFDGDGKLRGQFSAFQNSFTGGVNLAVGDLTGDGKAEIITAPGAGGGPQVKIFTGDGKLKLQFLAYTANFRGGVNLAAGDFNGDGKAEIITAPGAGGGPHVKVFDDRGRLQSQFMAYKPDFYGGVKVAAADFDGKIANRRYEILTGPGPGGGPHIRIFNERGQVRSQFMAFDRNFRGGVSVAATDINNDGDVEIIAGAGPGGGPHIRSFDFAGKIMNAFYGYEENFRGGLNVAALENKR